MKPGVLTPHIKQIVNETISKVNDAYRKVSTACCDVE